MNGVARSASAEAALREIATLPVAEHVDHHSIGQTALTCCSIAEVYVDNTLLDLIELSGVRDIGVGRYLLTHYGLQNLSWPDRFALLGKGFGIHVQGQRAGQEFVTLLNFRNAVAHGYWRVTQQQKKNPIQQLDLENRLEQVLGVLVRRGVLIPSTSTSSRIIAVAQSYMKTLDREVMSTFM